MYALTGTAPPLAASLPQQPAWTQISEKSVQEAFQAASNEACDDLRAIQLDVGQHILREDIPAVLRQAAGQELSGAHLAALSRCFALDASATISWSEFERSWKDLQQLGTSATAAGASSRAKMKHSTFASQPATEGQSVGWHHAQAPLQARERRSAKGTDVTRGEGSSSASYYGMYL